MARFNITLPDALKDLLKTEAEQLNVKPSSLIAQSLKEHYQGTSKAAYEEELQVLQQQNAKLRQKVDQFKDDTAENAAAHDIVVRELQAEFETAKILTKRLEQDTAEKDEKIRQLEQDLAATSSTIQEQEQGLQELLKQVEQERASKATVKTGLQHELELTQNNLKKAEEHVVELKGQIQDLKDDKHSLQKQLELVTLRLPAPKEGFWARVFGRKKKEEVQQ